MKTARKPFRTFLKNSKTHSLEFVISLVQRINPELSYDDAKAVALKVHNNGKALIAKGSREACRKAARIVREAGEDTAALRYLSLEGQGPMKTTIDRN